MNRENVIIKGENILLSLFEKYKNEPWVLSQGEINDKIFSFFSGKWDNPLFKISTHKIGLKSGITIDEFNTVHFLVDHDRHVNRRLSTLNEINEIFQIHDSTRIKINYVWTDRYLIMSEPEIKFLQEFLQEFNNEVDRKIKSIEKSKRDDEKKEKERVKSLKKSQNSLLKEFDKDGNGVIDVIEGDDDFMKLFKKHQKKIIELDRDFVQKFVKISNYLKTKRKNIQDVFSSIKNTENKSQLDNNVGVLKNQIHTYELLLFHSINMITSAVDDDLIVFYEIYESFDKLNMFNSNWENEVSQKLINIGEGLSELMSSINSMERNIVSGLNELSYVTQEGFYELGNSVTRELKNIGSSIDFNNLLTGISTYQLYKINKQTKGLIE
tara:strand:+ start:348 stop:1493 length:1146 start_codon:yes stop_codon:yes gene_type:complete